jgi:uncharacterized membrane protein YeaQ/YmgE (transglycosylase-associated protein family)
VVVVLVALAAVIVLFLLAWVVVGLILKLLWWAIIGLVIGAIARLILPGKQTIGVLATAISGIAAAFLGGVIAHIFGFGSVLQFVIAVLGAVVIVAILSSASSSART